LKYGRHQIKFRLHVFPFLPGHELTDKVVADLINQYSN